VVLGRSGRSISRRVRAGGISRSDAEASLRGPGLRGGGMERAGGGRVRGASRSRNMAMRSSRSRSRAGHDVTRYTLQCFGGREASMPAGGGRAGNRAVNDPPAAGVLSAYGMGGHMVELRQRSLGGGARAGAGGS
jgi:N-methylhydantoinase A/oxoprolinase/acetone carboxylase beta subunit